MEVASLTTAALVPSDEMSRNRSLRPLVVSTQKYVMATMLFRSFEWMVILLAVTALPAHVWPGMSVTDSFALVLTVEICVAQLLTADPVYPG